MSRLLAACIALTIALPTAGEADEIDLHQKISQLLGPTVLAQLNARAPCKLFFECHGIRFRGVKLEQVRTDYSEVKPAAVPESVVGETFTLRNCSSSERQEVRSTTMEYVEGYSITKTDTITNSLGASANFDIFGQKIGMTSSQTVSFTTSETVNKTTKRTETENTTEKILPYTDLLVKVERRITQAYLDYSGVAKVSAQIVMDMAGGAHGWDFNLGQVSDFLKDPEITLRGQIWNARAQDIKKTIRETKYTPETCPAGDPLPAKPL